MGESWLGYTGVREYKTPSWAHLFSSTSSFHEWASISREAGGLEERCCSVGRGEWSGLEDKGRLKLEVQ